MQLITRILLLTTILVLCAACGAGATSGEAATPTSEAPLPAADAPPDIRGTITTLQLSTDASRGIAGTMLVEGPVEAGTKFDRASITFTKDTRLFEHVGDERRPATVDAFRVGQRVEAWFTGPVLESYPVQAGVLEIVIVQQAGTSQ